MFENCEFLIVLTISVYPIQRVQTDQADRPKTVGLEGPMDQPTSHSKKGTLHSASSLVSPKTLTGNQVTVAAPIISQY
jgi:hypothetical protein